MITAIIWATMQMISPAPRYCGLLSSLMIFGAYKVAPFLDARTLELSMISLFIVVMLLCPLLQLLLKQKPRYTLYNATHMAILGYPRGFGFPIAIRLASHLLCGRLSAYAGYANMILFVIASSAASVQKPLMGAHLCGVLLSRILGELTNQEWMLYYGMQSLAGVSQAVSHATSRQASTLGSHEANKKEPRWKKLGFEYSHVVYFPNFCIHSTMESLHLTAASEVLTEKNEEVNIDFAPASASDLKEA